MNFGKLLEEIVVLDFTQAIASAFCARILADFGAEVLKVERYPHGDISRSGAGIPIDGSNQIFLLYNVGKKSLCVDMHTPEAVDLLKKLVGHADVVLEGFSPGQMKKYGLEYESLQQLKPDIIYCSMSAFGLYGPYRDWVALASIINAMSGLVYMTGEPDGPPLVIPSNADTNAAVNACLAVVSALVYRERTGIGQYIDTSMLDSLIFMDTMGVPLVAFTEGEADPKRPGRHRESMVPYGVYECKGEYVMLQVSGGGEHGMWGRFCKAIGHPEMITDSRFDTSPHRRNNREETISRIQEWFDNQPSAMEAVEYLQKHRVPCAPVLSPRQVFFDPNTRERGLIGKIYHPDIDREAPYFVTPYKFSKTPVQVESGTPLLGQDNEYILQKYLSYTDDQIKEAYEGKIIYQDPRVNQLRARGRI